MASNGEEPRNITVSLSTLRSELATIKSELEKELISLELRIIQSLASRGDLELVKRDVDKLKESALVKAGPVYEDVMDIKKKMESLVQKSEKVLNLEQIKEVARSEAEEVINDASTKLWTTRSRLIGITVVLVALATFCLDLFLAVHK